SEVTGRPEVRTVSPLSPPPQKRQGRSETVARHSPEASNPFGDDEATAMVERTDVGRDFEATHAGEPIRAAEPPRIAEPTPAAGEPVRGPPPDEEPTQY